MKLVQLHLPERGNRVGLLAEDGRVVDITSRADGILSTSTCWRLAARRRGWSAWAADWPGASERATPSPTSTGPRGRKVPSSARLWTPRRSGGAGMTYRRNAGYSIAHEGPTKDIYDFVYESARPGLFFNSSLPTILGAPGRDPCSRGPPHLV